MVIEAKKTTENIEDIKCIKQAFSYANSPIISAPFFVISNASRTLIYKTKNCDFINNNLKFMDQIKQEDLQANFNKLYELVSKEKLSELYSISKTEMNDKILKRINDFNKLEDIIINIPYCKEFNDIIMFKLDLNNIDFPNGMWFKVYININDIIEEIGTFELISYSDTSEIFIKIAFDFKKDSNIFKVINFFDGKINLPDKLYAKPCLPIIIQNIYNTYKNNMGVN